MLAIAKFRPSPIYVMDEVDAALDEINQGRLATVLAQVRSKRPDDPTNRALIHEFVAQVLGTHSRCQTIAISHHADFQRGAARIVEVSKGLSAIDGTTMVSKVICHAR